MSLLSKVEGLVNKIDDYFTSKYEKEGQLIADQCEFYKKFGWRITNHCVHPVVQPINQEVHRAKDAMVLTTCITCKFFKQKTKGVDKK